MKSIEQTPTLQRVYHYLGEAKKSIALAYAHAGIQHSIDLAVSHHLTTAFKKVEDASAAMEKRIIPFSGSK